jgi:hypothetical protein
LSNQNNQKTKRIYQVEANNTLPAVFITGLFISLKMRYENVSEKKPISADEGAATKNNNQYAI